MKLRRKVLGAGILALIFTASLCGSYLVFMHDDMYYRAQIREELSWTAGPSPRIVVELSDGNISVVQSVGETVTSVLDRFAVAELSQSAAAAAASAIQVSTTQNGDTIRITIRPDPKVRACQLWANLELRVPNGAKLDLLTENGQIFVGQYKGGPNGAQLTTSPVVVGSVKAKTLERSGTSRPQIYVDIATRPPVPGAPSRAITLDLESRHGSIAIKGEDLIIDAKAPGETIVRTHETDHGLNTSETKMAGSITFSGSLAEGLHSFQASDHISVRIQRDARLRVDAITTHGVISSDFPVKEGGEREPTRLIGQVGDDPKIFLKLRNRGGNVLIEKQPPEKLTPVMVQDFEKASSLPTVWVVDLPKENASAQLSADHPHEGEQCLKLHYHFLDDRLKPSLGVGIKTDIQKPVHKLHAWLYGDISNCSCDVLVSDASGESHQYDGGVIDFAGWREIVIDLDSLHDATGGDMNGKMNYPLTGITFAFTQPVDSERLRALPAEGDLYFDSVSVDSE